MTRYCELYANLRNTSEPVWIDTVGYDDSKKLKDEDSFKEVLKFIDKHDVRDVHGIVWTVMPQERMDARYVQLTLKYRIKEQYGIKEQGELFSEN